MDWSDPNRVPGVWEPADVKKIVATPRHVVIHRQDGTPLYLGRGLALAIYGHAVQAGQREVSEALASADARQRAAIVRDRRIDFAILACMFALCALAVVLSWR